MGGVAVDTGDPDERYNHPRLFGDLADHRLGGGLADFEASSGQLPVAVVDPTDQQNLAGDVADRCERRGQHVARSDPGSTHVVEPQRLLGPRAWRSPTGGAGPCVRECIRAEPTHGASHFLLWPLSSLSIRLLHWTSARRHIRSHWSTSPHLQPVPEHPDGWSKVSGQRRASKPTGAGKPHGRRPATWGAKRRALVRRTADPLSPRRKEVAMPELL